MKLPRFELQRVNENNQREPPEIVPVLSLPWNTRTGRRGFLGAGVMAGAVLGVVGYPRSASGRSSSALGYDGECTDGANAHTDHVYSVAFSADGQWLSSGSSDRTVKVWKMPSGNLATTLRGHTDSVYSVRFDPNGQWLLSRSADRTVRIWTVPSGDLSATLTVQGPVAISPQGRWLASGSANETVNLWELPSGKFAVACGGHTGGASSVAFSLDGKFLITASRAGVVKVWEVPSGALAAAIESPTGVSTLALSPTGEWLASACSPGGIPDPAEKVVRLWEMPFGKRSVALKGHTKGVPALVFSPDGKWLASGSDDQNARIWRVPSGKPAATLRGHSSSVSELAFSPDGQYLASGSANTGPSDPAVRIWAMPSGKLAVTLAGHLGGVGSISFHPDGKLLASASKRTVRLWEIPSGRLVSCLFDPAALDVGKEAMQIARTDESGTTVVSTLSCGSSIPPGATCTCNCVPGTYKRALPTGGGMGSGSCTCNKVCTCVPVCQAHRLLDPDPVVAALARQILLSMGAREVDYLEWAASTACDSRTRQAVFAVLDSVRGNTNADPRLWPSAEACIERLDSDDEVVAILAAQGLAHAPAAAGRPGSLRGGVLDRVTRLADLARERNRTLRREIEAFVELRA